MITVVNAVIEQPSGTATAQERVAAQQVRAVDRWHDFRREADLRVVRSRRRASAG